MHLIVCFLLLQGRFCFQKIIIIISNENIYRSYLSQLPNIIGKEINKLLYFEKYSILDFSERYVCTYSIFTNTYLNFDLSHMKLHKNTDVSVHVKVKSVECGNFNCRGKGQGTDLVYYGLSQDRHS